MLRRCSAPNIRLQYDDGFSFVADASSNDIQILDAIDQLSLADRIELAQALEAEHAPARTAIDATPGSNLSGRSGTPCMVGI